MKDKAAYFGNRRAGTPAPSVRQQRKFKYYYKLYVSYPLALYLADAKRDRQVEKIVGAKIGASGAGFGVRDVEFYFDTKRELMVAKRRLRSVFNVNKLLKREFPLVWNDDRFRTDGSDV